MYLIDTSVWIDYFNDVQTEATNIISELAEIGVSLGICGIVFQELLQGVSSESDFINLSKYLETQHFYHAMEPIKSHENAAKIYFECRSRGLTIRSTIDCLIAQIALDNDLVLIHNDNDYVKIQKVRPQLKILPRLK